MCIVIYEYHGICEYELSQIIKILLFYFNENVIYGSPSIECVGTTEFVDAADVDVVGSIGSMMATSLEPSLECAVPTVVSGAFSVWKIRFKVSPAEKENWIEFDIRLMADRQTQIGVDATCTHFAAYWQTLAEAYRLLP